jgi:hypothetical protein
MRIVSTLASCVLILSCSAPDRTGSSEEGTNEQPITYSVGPGQAYPDFSTLPNLNPGDVLQVAWRATPYPPIKFTRSGTAAQPIVIQGIRVNGNRPVISGAAPSCAATGCNVNTVTFELSNHIVFQGFDVTAGASRCIFHHAADITIRDTVVHDCPNHGILGADYESGSLTLDHVEVHHCGKDDQKHQIYMSTDQVMYPGSVFRMQYCYVHDATGGHNVKSRAERNEIYYNWIEGAKYHELELIGPTEPPEDLKREDSDVVGNVIRKGGMFPNAHTTRLGGDGSGQTWGRYRFVNNTFLLAAGSGSAFRIFDGVDTLEAHNNVFYREGGGSIELVREVEASSPMPLLLGTHNWAMTGSPAPSGWTGTVLGSSPGFTGLTALDLHPIAGSPLLDLGQVNPPTIASRPFPAPLGAPAFDPPVQSANQTPVPRRAGTDPIDVGAFEGGSTGGNPSPIVDPTAPTVSLTSPANGATVSGLTQVSAAAADNVAVVGVQFLLDGANLGAEVTLAPYGLSWNSGAAAAGVHTLSARARDAAGNVATSTLVTLTVSAPQPGACQTVGNTFVNVPFASQTGTFTAQFDVKPSASPTDAVIALTQNAQQSYAGLAANVRFNTAGKIDVRSGGGYGVSTLSFSANASYHFRLVASPSTHSYAVYVTPPSGAEQALELNAAFRTEQSGVSALNNLTAYVDPTAAGTLELCNFVVSGSDQTAPTVAITAPTQGASILAGTTATVTASASDSVGVIGVQFTLDGMTLGAELTSPPYTVVWNTAAAALGTHALAARARDAAGNLGTSTPVAVTLAAVSGDPSADATNLLPQGSFESSLGGGGDASKNYQLIPVTGQTIASSTANPIAGAASLRLTLTANNYTEWHDRSSATATRTGLLTAKGTLRNNGPSAVTVRINVGYSDSKWGNHTLGTDYTLLPGVAMNITGSYNIPTPGSTQLLHWIRCTSAACDLSWDKAYIGFSPP